MRRNVESVNARFGNLVAIVAGDFLLARSAEIAASLGHRDRRAAGRHPGPAVPGPGRRGPGRLQHRAHRGRLLRHHRRQDGRAHVHLVPDRRPHRRPAPRRGGGPHHLRPLLRHGLPAARRHPRRRRHRGGAGQAAPARTWPRGSTPCRCCWPWATPGTGPELRPLLGAPLDQPERDKARAIVAASGGHRRHRRRRPALRRRGRRRGRVPCAERSLGTLARDLGAGSLLEPDFPSRAMASHRRRPLRRPRRIAVPALERSGRRVGKAMTSRMLATSASSMTRRSMPMPEAGGGRQAVLEGPQVVLVDGHGLLVARRRAPRPGPRSVPAGRRGRRARRRRSPARARPRWARSARPDRGPTRCRRARGDTSAGKSITNTGPHRSGSVVFSYSSSRSLPAPHDASGSTPAAATRRRSSSTGVWTSTASPVASVTSSAMVARRHGGVRSRLAPLVGDRGRAPAAPTQAPTPAPPPAP